MTIPGRLLEDDAVSVKGTTEGRCRAKMSTGLSSFEINVGKPVLHVQVLGVKFDDAVAGDRGSGVNGVVMKRAGGQRAVRRLRFLDVGEICAPEEG